MQLHALLRQQLARCARLTGQCVVCWLQFNRSVTSVAWCGFTVKLLNVRRRIESPTPGQHMNMAFLPVRAMPASLHRLVLTRTLLTRQWAKSLVEEAATFLPVLLLVSL